MLTIFLIIQELNKFFIIKPTGTSKEEKRLRASDLPEVVLCVDPPFDAEALAGYGYLDDTTYYRGAMDKRFVGWNGDENVNKSSHAILQDVLAADLNIKSLLKHVSFRQDNFQKVDADVKIRTLTYPHGRCLSIFPSKASLNNTHINSLRISMNQSYVKQQNLQSSSLRVYFMDNTNSLRVYPNDLEMLGDRVKMEMTRKQPMLSTYKTQISRSVHIPGDPRLDCVIYTNENSYSKCINNELKDIFMNKIGCMPPLLGKDSKLICNTKFNVSKQSYWDITILFWSLYYHDREYECRKPCTKSTYTSTFVHKTPSQSISLILVFDDTIDVANTFLSIDGQTLLTRLGGSVSSGRTLLWILGIIFAASQVSRKFFTRKKQFPR